VFFAISSAMEVQGPLSLYFLPHLKNALKKVLWHLKCGKCHRKILSFANREVEKLRRIDSVKTIGAFLLPLTLYFSSTFDSTHQKRANLDIASTGAGFRSANLRSSAFIVDSRCWPGRRPALRGWCRDAPMKNGLRMFFKRRLNWG